MNENKIAVSKKVQEEMTGLRQNATLNSHIPFLYKDTSGSFKILFHNVRSLHLHIADVIIIIIKTLFHEGKHITARG